MANININVGAKIFLSFATSSLELIRGESNTKTVTINYSNGTGQSIDSGEPLYTIGTPGQPGYIRITSVSDFTLSNTGSIQVQVQSFPPTNAVDGPITFTYDQSNITINVDYNSRPVISDLNVSIDNRTEHDFTVSEFVNAFTDYDPDTLSEIQINGTTTGYTYDVNGTLNYVPLVSGTWIPVNNISRIRYVAPDQNTAHQQSNPYKVRDSKGSESL